MCVRRFIVASCLVGLAGTAAGQTRLVYTQDNAEFLGYGAEATAPDVAVSGLAAIVCGSTRLALFPKATTLPAPGPLDLRLVRDPNNPGAPYTFPFELSNVSQFQDRFLDPRAAYDAVNDRLWIAYLETNGTGSGAACPGEISKLHVAVSKDPADFPPMQTNLDTFDDSHWWYYTGPTVRLNPPTVPVTSGSFDLTFNSDPLGPQYKAYKHFDTESRFPFHGTPRLVTVAVDGTRASGRGVAIFTPNSFEPDCDSPSGNAPLTDRLNQALLIVPLEHVDPETNTPQSILEGFRPDETDIILIQLSAQNSTEETDRYQDTAEAAYAVQEPYEQYDNAVFLISGINSRAFHALGVQDAIRLKGLFYDASSPGAEWSLQQRHDGSELEDMPLTGSLSTLKFHPTPPIKDAGRPRTPDTSVPRWGPAAEGYIFHSAVLTEDAMGNERIFAVHTVFPDNPSDPGKPLNKWVVQWYVIDPDMANFRDTPVPSTMWKPEIVAAGRLDAGEGDRYHPLIVVNRQGVAFIEYTYSDDTTWPETRRVRLDTTYTGIVGSETPPMLGGPHLKYVEAGVPAAPSDFSWANYAGIQADPTDNCRYWSVHTLVHDPGTPLPLETTGRDVWLHHRSYGTICFQSPAMLDLNDDNEVDAYDLAAFTVLYDRRARRVDINGDGVVDAIDMALYFEAYDAYTRGR